MTATDELRRLLDGRGVEWQEARDGSTVFSDGDGHVRWAIACGAAKHFFEVGPLTPEQAIEATLGSDLKAENAKLRELVQNLRRVTPPDVVGVVIGANTDHQSYYKFDKAFRELGIEVDA